MDNTTFHPTHIVEDWQEDTGGVRVLTTIIQRRQLVVEFFSAPESSIKREILRRLLSDIENGEAIPSSTDWNRPAMYALAVDLLVPISSWRQETIDDLIAVWSNLPLRSSLLTILQECVEADAQMMHQWLKLEMSMYTEKAEYVPSIPQVGSPINGHNNRIGEIR